MRILVTGSDGFIGRHLVNLYGELGHQVEGFDIKSISNSVITSSDLITHYSDFEPEIISHHGAICSVADSIRNPIEHIKNQLIDTIQFLDLAVAFGSKFIFASSGGAVYGELDSGCPQNSEHALQMPISPYGINKLAVEHYLRFYKEVYRLKSVALRYGNVYGPGCHGAVANFTRKIALNEPVQINGTGEQTRDYVHIDDVLAVNVEALKDDHEGIFNVGTGIATSINELLAEISQILGKGYEVAYNPKILGEVKHNCLKPSIIQKRTPMKLKQGLSKTIPSLLRCQEL